MLALSLMMVVTAPCRAQVSASSGPNDAGGLTVGGHGRILLVLPFDNRSGQPSLDWIREAAPQILSARFASAGLRP